jgi:hypothetical protein
MKRVTRSCGAPRLRYKTQTAMPRHRLWHCMCSPDFLRESRCPGRLTRRRSSTAHRLQKVCQWMASSGTVENYCSN